MLLRSSRYTQSFSYCNDGYKRIGMKISVKLVFWLGTALANSGCRCRTVSNFRDVVLRLLPFIPMKGACVTSSNARNSYPWNRMTRGRQPKPSFHVKKQQTFLTIIDLLFNRANLIFMQAPSAQPFRLSSHLCSHVVHSLGGALATTTVMPTLDAHSVATNQYQELLS